MQWKFIKKNRRSNMFTWRNRRRNMFTRRWRRRTGVFPWLFFLFIFVAHLYSNIIYLSFEQK
jgi:hypothetical protein